MEEQVIIHRDSKYRVVIERAASTRGQDGFKIEVNGDDKLQVVAECEALLLWAKATTAKGGE